jgi:Kef-type K+ transport system membrane component KefB
VTEAEFLQYLTSWHDFFLTAGAAAATLVGLLFVGLSVNVDEVMDPGRQDLRSLAEQAFNSFVYVLLISLFFLTPQQHVDTLFVELVLLGVLGLLRIAFRSRRALGGPDKGWAARRRLIRLFGLPAIGSVALLLIGVGVDQHQPDALYWLVAVLLIFLTTAADASWDLLVRVSAEKRERRQRAEEPTPNPADSPTAGVHSQ